MTATSGSIETLLIALGNGATATGRVVFDGASPLPQHVSMVSVPFFSSTGGRCASRPAAVAPDWSFKIEGLAGTCSNMAWLGLGRWLLKAVLFDGADVMDRAVTFKAGQQYRNVQVIFTDRPAAVTFRVSDEEGQATQEYVALVLPSEKARWNTRPNSSPVRAYVPPQPEMMALQGSSPVARAPVLAPRRRGETMEGLRPGEYLAIAVDNSNGKTGSTPGCWRGLRRMGPESR